MLTYYPARFRRALSVLSIAGGCLVGYNHAVAQETNATSEADAFAQIRAEIEAMRKSYETEISQLRNRVEELESEREEDQVKLAKVEQRAVAAEAKASSAANTAASAAAQSDALTEAQMAQIEESFDQFDVTRGFEFGGYFRSGLGVDDDGNTMEAFQAPGSQSKYRLGNEAETYVELLFGYTFPDLDLPEGTDFYFGFMPSYVVPSSNADDSVFSVRQAYASAKGVWAEQP
ncbi:MAG: carbohydrate porin, partial [Coraliomargarita sp.]